MYLTVIVLYKYNINNKQVNEWLANFCIGTCLNTGGIKLWMYFELYKLQVAKH